MPAWRLGRVALMCGCAEPGEVAERLKAQHWKCCLRLKPQREFESRPLRFPKQEAVQCQIIGRLSHFCAERCALAAARKFDRRPFKAPGLISIVLGDGRWELAEASADDDAIPAAREGFESWLVDEFNAIESVAGHLFKMIARIKYQEAISAEPVLRV